MPIATSNLDLAKLCNVIHNLTTRWIKENGLVSALRESAWDEEIIDDFREVWKSLGEFHALGFLHSKGVKVK